MRHLGVHNDAIEEQPRNIGEAVQRRSNMKRKRSRQLKAQDNVVLMA